MFKQFCKNLQVCNFFAIRLRMLFSIVNDVDVQTTRKYHPVFPKYSLSFFYRFVLNNRDIEKGKVQIPVLFCMNVQLTVIGLLKFLYLWCLKLYSRPYIIWISLLIHLTIDSESIYDRLSNYMSICDLWFLFTNNRFREDHT